MNYNASTLIAASLFYFASPASAAAVDDFVGKWQSARAGDDVTATCRKVGATRADCRIVLKTGQRTYRYTLEMTYKGERLHYGPDSKGRTYIFWISGSALKAKYDVTNGRGTWIFKR